MRIFVLGDFTHHPTYLCACAFSAMDHPVCSAAKQRVLVQRSRRQRRLGSLGYVGLWDMSARGLGSKELANPG